MIRRLLILVPFACFAGCGCGDDDDVPEGDGDADADSDADSDADTDGDSDADGDAECDAVENPAFAGGDCQPSFARQITDAADLPDTTAGDGVAGIGDWMLGNDRVRYYFDDVGNQNLIAPTGGTLIDILAAGQIVDHFGQLSSIFFLEQDNFLSYDEIEAGTEGTTAFVVARGTVEGGPQGDFTDRLAVETRYELRACETALRIWTDVTNLTGEAIGGGLGTVTTDLILWGPRGMKPFCAGAAGQGYECPGFDPTNPLGSVEEFPYIGAAANFAGPFSLALVSLNQGGILFGVNDDQVSAVGESDALGAPLSAGDTRTYGRALLVATGRNDIASASDLAFTGQARCGSEPVGDVCVTLDLPKNLPFPPGDPRNGTVLFYRGAPGDDPHSRAARTPMTHAAVDADGAARATLPAGSYYYEVTGPGGAVTLGGPVEVVAGVDGDCTSSPVGDVGTVSVELSGPEGPITGRVIFKGTGDIPDPSFGPSHGASPAANVALVGSDGLVDVTLPVGTYHVYATHGIEWSLGEMDLEVDEAGDDVSFELEPLVDTTGMLSADMHVHSVLSWDSSLPLTDRVLAYAAEGVDVVVATEHDVVGDYGPTVLAMGLDDVVVTIPGLESTGAVTSETFPHTIGHHNAWPLTPDPELPRDGAPLDEGLTVPELYDRLRTAGAEVVQLNHGRASTVGSVWLGWLDACGFDPTEPADSFPGCDLGTWDVMEVMNGSSVPGNLADRNDWFAFLSQLPFIPGTANSDSHRLVLEEAGYPRTYVAMNDDLAELDAAAFDEAVKAGRMIGTNGPFVRATASGPEDAVIAAPGGVLEAGPKDHVVLVLTVQAVPWIPVDEVVVYANGQVVANLDDELDDSGAVVRFDDVVDLGTFDVDTWIVVEAGTPWPAEGEEPPASPDPLAAIAPGVVPHAFTNPIFVTVDGDADFDPPGL